MLSPHARNEWLTIAGLGVLLSVAAGVFELWWVIPICVLVALAGLLFFRDPDRAIPSQRNAVVAPADGRVSSVHEIEHFEPFDGPAVCIRIFLSVFDVHINRCPCHGRVHSITHKPGAHRNALNPDSAEVNENNLIVLEHPVKGHPVAAVRQIAGLLARTVVCTVEEQSILQRGQRIGLIKLGSTTELYLPTALKPQVAIQAGQKVSGAVTVLAMVTPPTQSENAVEAQTQEEPAHV
jgi:phosphatidylserine decarboxylase